MSNKPISIIECPGGYNVFVHEAPIVRSEKGLDFDRTKAGLKVPKKYKPPTSTLPVIFKDAGDAAHVAHKVGRYILKLGDFVSGYTNLVLHGPAWRKDEWWTKALNS